MTNGVCSALAAMVLLSNMSRHCLAFSAPRQYTTALSMSDENSLFGNFPNPFGGAGNDPVPPSVPPSPQSFDDGGFDPSPEALIARAKIVLSTNLGVLDPKILAENFIWIGPQLGSTSLEKKDYVAAGKFFNVKAAFPDLDYRAHDFRIDSKDPLTVRLTARTVGTMRGKLRLRNEELEPNGVQMKCPPEAISITFDNGGKVSKICSGFVMDRLVGNTGGLCGVMGAAAIGGSPPSDWEIYPATAVLGRFFGRPIKQLEEPTSFLAPFPETVMIQLAKGIFAADMASSDPTLLGTDFTYMEPYEGPINKDSYLKGYASQIFAGYDPELTHFRVDPYDPYRVWVDVRPVGITPEGITFECPPEAFSFTFDDDGFCTRLTANAVMDPSSGNTGGLGGEEGIKYASGAGSAGITTRPLPQVLGRLRKRVLAPVTKLGVDQFSKEESVQLSDEALVKPKSSADQQTKTEAQVEPDDSDSPTQRPFFALDTNTDEDSSEEMQGDAQAAAAERKAKAKAALAEQQAKAQAATAAAAEAKKLKAEEARKKAESAAAARKQAEEERKTKVAEALAARERQVDAAAKALKKAKEAKKAREAEAAELRRKADEAKAKAEQFARQKAEKTRAQQAEEERRAKAAVEEATRLAKQQKAKEALEAKKQAEAERIRMAQIAAQAKQRKEEERKAKAAEAASAKKDKRTKKAEEAARTAKPGATISLFGFELNQPESMSSSKNERARSAKETVSQAKPGATISLFGFGANEDEAKRPKKKDSAKSAEETASKAKPGATIPLFGFGQTQDDASARAKEAERKAIDAKPGSTISLFGLGQEKKKEEPKAAPSRNRSSPKLTKAPPGVPSVLNWRKRGDGGIAGLIYGSRNFDDGERVETSPVVSGDFENGSVVTTGSGSRYFLTNDQSLRRLKQKTTAKDVANAKPGATIALTKQQKLKDAQAAKTALEKAEPGATVSLFGLEIGLPGKAPSEKSVPLQSRKKASAPRGVPSLKNWRRNFDGSLTGFITGSKSFSENEKITTSRIVSGKVSSGEVVQTGSGSKYFLT